MAKSTYPVLIALLLSCQRDATAPSPSPPEVAANEPPPTTAHHSMSVRIETSEHRITVEDEIRFPSALSGPIELELHGGLELESSSKGAELVSLGQAPDTGPIELERYRLSVPAGTRKLNLTYSGAIHHPANEGSNEIGATTGASLGMISDEGVYLTGATGWLPTLEDIDLVSFEMKVELPPDWRSLSQGERTQREQDSDVVRDTWVERSLQQQVYLIAGPFTEYRKEGDTADAVVLLRTPDDDLAKRYLDLTEPYLRMYAELIGPYPYSKFTLLENFWETGYGMPSFTALGPRVIRMPFIPFTSYPHEILHNWWGNSVYVDYESGNWSEGLTTYLADHLLAEQRGGGDAHRRGVLQRYADYVDENDDFALTEFRGRHNAVTQAVGYGKTLMVFHMLRLQLGDEGFVAGLRKLYADHAFARTDWPGVADAFSSATDTDLDAFFEQWVSRPGAPALQLRDVTVSAGEGATHVRGVLEQTQAGEAFALTVPVAVEMQGDAPARWHEVVMQAKSQTFELDVPGQPVHLAIDPSFDLFRRLHREETPPAISQAFGADKILLVLPSAAPTKLRDAYRGLAESWRKGQESRIEIQTDDALEQLPGDRAVWLLGWDNRFRTAIAQNLAPKSFTSDGVTVAGQKIRRQGDSAVIVTRAPDNPEQALAWVATDTAAAIPGLARKLPHYGKYGYLGFAGDEPKNTVKGQWPVTKSPLSVPLGESGEPLVLTPRQPLAAVSR